MQHPWWILFLRSIVTFAVIALVLKWIYKSLNSRRLETEKRVLQHQHWVLLTGLLGSVLFFGLAIVSNTWGKNATTSIWSTLVFVGAGSLSVPFLADYFFARHRVTERGIHYGSMFDRRASMDWSEVERVSFSPNMGWFLLESKSGAKARISIFLSGVKEFARLVLDQVPREKVDRDACILLMQSQSEGSGIFVDPNSKIWQEALSKAQQTIPLLRSLRGDASEPILIKYAIPSATGAMEHVWGELVQLDEASFRVTLETPMLSGAPSSDPPFELPISAIEDWVITLSDGSIRGAFTTQAEIQFAKESGQPLPDHIAAMEGRFRDC